MKPDRVIVDKAEAEADGIRQRNAGRPNRHEAESLPDLILDAAEALFLRQGFGSTSLNQIAAAAGVTKRTLYVKIGDKEALFAAFVRRMLARRRENLITKTAPGTLRARLIKFGEASLANALDPAVVQLHRVMVTEAPRFPALARLMEEQISSGTRARLAELLDDEVRQGRLVVGDPMIAARLLFIMMIGEPQRAVLFGLEPWTPMKGRQWIDAAVNLFLDGCRGVTNQTPK
ncbi:MAG: TetR/AcrR family transcriptional regulator [Acidocella sp.]|nr:TetR/AcrR family transcriptional regulator [Acidocella sp.]